MDKFKENVRNYGTWVSPRDEFHLYSVWIIQEKLNKITEGMNCTSV